MLRKLFFAALALALLAVLGGAGGIGFLFWHYGKDLPDYSQLAEYQPPMVTRVHAGDGRLMAEFATEKRVFVPYDSIPPRVVQAFIAAEDQNFFTHPGVDFIGLVRAMIQNVQNVAENRRLIGASTITQQVARNFLLTNQRSIDRKAREILLAFRIEKALSKEKILELYLNDIYLGSVGGSGAYGVAAAALTYFNKALDELTIEEAAYLAALPKAPSNYNPFTQAERAKGRRDYVIQRMQEERFITEAEAKQAIDAPLTVRRRQAEEVVRADFFAEEVRRELVERFGEEQAYRGGLIVRASVDPKLQAIADRVFKAGLVAYDRRHGYRGPLAKGVPVAANAWAAALDKTPLPPGTNSAGIAWTLAVVLKLEEREAEIGVKGGATGRIPLAELTWAREPQPDQKVGPAPKKPADVLAVGDVILVEPVAASADGKTRYPQGTYALRQVPEVSGGLIAMDPHTGRILALTGGWSFDQSQFNRATQAKRQPGSSFKPFVYLAGLENGFTPSSLLLDAPFVMDDGSGRKWRPDNFTEKFYGPTTMRNGLEQSRNLMTVRLAETIGMDRVAEMAERFGVTQNLPRYLAMSLGAGDTTLLHMAVGYAMIANGGKQIAPSVIDRVQDRNGRTIFRHDTRPCPGCNPGASLAGGFSGGTMPEIPDSRAQIIDPISAYQMVSMLQGVVQRGTGASIGAAIKAPLAGKTGTTNDFTDAWFVGFSADLVVGLYFGFDQPKTLGNQETGGRNSAPVFRDFMQEALAVRPALPFRAPPGVVMVRVNKDTGKLAAAGDKAAILEPFKPGSEPTLASEDESDEYPSPAIGVSSGEGDGSGEAAPSATAPAGSGAPGGAPRQAPSAVGVGGIY